MPNVIPQSPQKYDGTLGELFDRWARDVLVSPASVELFHRKFCDYVNSTNPLFLVRKVKDVERGENVATEAGLRFRPTDNSPAWWIHHRLFFDLFSQDTTFADFIEAVPCHMFQIKIKGPHVNKAKWHVAHIFDVNTGDNSYRKWDRRELVCRFARNVHPCNYFYVPLAAWKRYGGHPMVIAFFYDRFRDIYRSVWDDFLQMVIGLPHIPAQVREFRYSF